MSMLPTIANALAEFVYDKDIRFTSFTAPDGAPCFGCLTTIHRDARLLCVIEDSVKEICLCCQNSKKKCGSIPREILGAAQFYWNHISRPQALAANPDDLHGKEVWRICNFDVAETIQTQEAAATRELLSLQLLKSAGVNFSPEEMRARVAAATPLYARDDSMAVRLRKALRRLPNADKTPYGSDDGELEDLPHELENSLIA
ncbi:uncharacterized protein FPRO_11226 [Fusarium proliferatum ET1]|uniref:Uncharacterized protein n=1 Tax=Fusarium proliferatum (strain ET1) TaxID=1227346 RepID=A0A1L7VM83_FUSPR|nr:uncharacterized protein FPRO_11226 [Fusarium proliferatum ET1]CZR41637.1 uncharacterized protein FPRO_11226 [Fusarium proliferatum ET1]